jgi:hypothetical protein
MPKRRLLTRIHVWLGWIVGVPLLFWTVSGVWMAARPIEEVRGVHLRAKPVPLTISGQAMVPQTGKRAVKSLVLEQQPSGARWIVAYADGKAGRADPVTGAVLGDVPKGEAEAIAKAAFAGNATLERTARFPVDANPIDLRRERPAWQAHFSDGTNVYIDAESGAVLAVRSAQWRWYDWMWGLHIMDLQTREDTSHAVLIGFAGIAVISALLGLVLLPIATRRWPKKRG